MPKIAHFRDKCIGCNSCVETAPNQWKMNEIDGKSDLKRSVEKKGVFLVKITYAELEENRQAAKDCPVNIIKVLE